MSRVSKFDKIVVGKATINVVEKPASLVAEAAFVDTNTGATHGMTMCRSWSATTIARLRDLLDAMSVDLELTHFVDGGTEALFDTPKGSGAMESTPQGLGEMLGAADDGIPQG